MADQKPSNREKVKEIVAGIEGGIKDLFQSERYAEYLSTMSRFHNYSYRNTLLIHMQRPDATLVAGFTKWKNQFGRHVKKGEKGLTILAPTPFKKKIEETKRDPDTKSPLLDAEGNIITEEKVVEIPMFRPVKVFDVSQTDGKPLPSLAVDLAGNVRHYEAFMEALRRASPVPIGFERMVGSESGYFSPSEQRIAVKEGMSQIQTVQVLIHEITHATLHNYEKNQRAASAGEDGTEPSAPKDRSTEEVEAESVSYAVCQYYGIEVSARSLGYIASWSSDKELPELKSSLETISKTANILITNIDRHFAEICKEQGIVLEQAEQNASVAEAAEPHETKSEPEEYLYCSEYNPQHVGANDRRCIRARKPSELEMKPEQIIFYGSNEMCDKLLTLLAEGRLHRDDFFTVTSAVISRYATADGKELDAFTGPDDKVYMGKRCLYDNRGHYLNHDRSLLHVSDNPKIYSLLFGSGYTETQTEMLEEGYFTQEDYAEFAALQADVLCQFVEDGPLLFAGKPFCFPMTDVPEREASPVQEQSEGLFLVDGRAYLHIQKGDGAYDYTIYDKATMRQLDGGQFAVLSSTGNFSVSLRENAVGIFRDGVSDLDLEGNTVEEAPLELVEVLQDAAMREMEETAKTFRKNTLEDTALDEYPMPDSVYFKTTERESEFLEDGMLRLSKECAMKLFEKDFTIYASVNGQVEEMVFDKDELAKSPPDTVFTVYCDEWEASPDFRQAVAERLNRQEEREAAFLNHAGDCFAIYQLRDGDETRDLRYMPLPGQGVDKAFYELAYTGALSPGQDQSALDMLWEQFNVSHPADYCRPSLSMSDIVALKQDGVVSCHYVDRLGFTALHGFIQPENYLKTAELSVEDDCNMIDGILNNGPKEPTVAELEAQAKAGQQISLSALAEAIQREKQEKKSVVAKLKEKPARPKAAQKKNKEKER